MTGLPAGLKLELGIGTAGAYVDVSADVDAMAGAGIRIGRTSEFAVPSAGTLQFTLINDVNCSTGQGSYTPGRQVLYDGVTAHPYYPMIAVRVNVRLTYTISATTYNRFVGTVNAWQPLLVANGMVPRVLIQSSDVLNRLSRITLQSVVLSEMLYDSPTYLWPLTDAAGSTSAAEAHGGPALIGSQLPTFGAAGPGTASSAEFGNSQKLRAAITPPVGAHTIEMAIYIASLPSYFQPIDSSSAAFGVFFNSLFVGSTATPLTLNAWHHLATAIAADGSSVLYWDGVAIDTPGAGSSGTMGSTFAIGDTFFHASGTLDARIAYVGITPTQLSAARVASHAAAVLDYAGDTTGTRISRYLTLAGLTSAGWNLDPGVAVVGSYPQAGKTILQACQDMAVTEGGGAVFYATPDGKARFADRNYRNSTTPVMTVDAGADLDSGTFQPSLDDLTLVNSATVSRINGAVTLSTQTYTNAASALAEGLTSTTLTSYATSDTQALSLAGYAVASQATPRYRLSKVAIDLLTATSAGLYAALASVQIGSRIRVTNLDGTAAPLPTVDLIVEGWSESISGDSYMIVLDTSPADNPPRGFADTLRAAPVPGNMTLNTTITRTGTTILIANSDGFFMTTTPGSYPFRIKIEEEEITLNGVPGGSSSPQTFTGCTRGANGTFAAAHTSGAVISLAPAYGNAGP